MPDVVYSEARWAPSREPRLAAAARRFFLGAFAFGLALDVSIGTWLGAGGTHSLASSLVLGLPLLLPAGWHFLTDAGIRRAPVALWLMTGFVGWCALSMIWARQTDGSALVATLSRAQLLAVVWIGYQLVRTDRDLRAVLTGYVLGGLGLVLLAWRNYLAGVFDVWERYAADGYDPNDMSIYLAIGIPMAGYLAGAARAGERWRLAFLLYVPAAVSAIALSGSRTGGLAAALAVAVAVGWLLLRNRPVAGMAVAVLLVGGAVALARAPTASVERILSIRGEAAAGGLGDRAGIWGAGVEVLPAHIVQGVGVGGFGEAVLARTGERIYAHNTPLSVAVELGLVGLLLFFGAFALALHGVRRAGLEAQVLVWSILATCFLGIQSLTWEQRKPLWLVLLVAIAAGALRPERRRVAAGAAR